MKEVISARERSARRTANVVRGDVKTVGGVTENGYSAALKRNILTYEHQQRQEWNEAMAFYDADGNQLGRVLGGHDYVPLPNWNYIPKSASGGKRDDLIFTHNHPGALDKNGYMRIGYSFSEDDMLIAVKYKAKEIRAVTPTYTFSFRRPTDGRKTTQADVRRAYDKAIRQVTSEGQDYVDRVGFNRTTNNRYEITYWHKINKLVAKELGWGYSKKRG